MDLLDLHNRREHEKERYRKAYKKSDYRMLPKRLSWFKEWADSIQGHLTDGMLNSVLDVGSGVGQALDMLKKRGAKVVQGVEFMKIQPKREDTMLIDGAHDLPFGTDAFDLVMCMDVPEHLILEEVPQILSEIFRVAHKMIRFEISHRLDRSVDPLHITVFPREWWLNQILIHMPNGARWAVDPDREAKKHYHTRLEIFLPPYDHEIMRRKGK